MKLSAIDQAFLDNYIKNGYDGTNAYLTIKPNVTRASASVLAHRLLKRDDIKAALDIKQTESAQSAIASRDYLIQEAHEIGMEARTAGKLNTALTAVETKGKLNRVYDRESDNPADYGKLIQTLVIQGDMNVYNEPNDTKTIDITSG
jgi:hypothetical protein